jgi:hypothetical protein
MKTNTGTLDKLRNHGKCGEILDNVLHRVLDRFDELEERISGIEDGVDDELENVAVYDDE